MKKVIISLLAGAALVQVIACNQAPTMDAATMDRKIDSMVQARTEEATKAADAACQERMKTEVMVKADSIYKAMTEKKAS